MLFALGNPEKLSNLFTLKIPTINKARGFTVPHKSPRTALGVPKTQCGAVLQSPS